MYHKTLTHQINYVQQNGKKVKVPNASPMACPYITPLTLSTMSSLDRVDQLESYLVLSLVGASAFVYRVFIAARYMEIKFVTGSGTCLT